MERVGEQRATTATELVAREAQAHEGGGCALTSAEGREERGGAAVRRVAIGEVEPRQAVRQRRHEPPERADARASPRPAAMNNSLMLLLSAPLASSSFAVSRRL